MTDRRQSFPLRDSYRTETPCVQTGRSRAKRLFPAIGCCEKCGKSKTERHHRDGNTINNDPSNIAILCRRCHMIEDGRLASLSANSRSAGITGGSKTGQIKKAQTHCKRGHPLSGDNVRVSQGKRICRTCCRMKMRLRNGIKESNWRIKDV
jgi:hypothetical protein